MAVRQEIQDFCAKLESRVADAVASAVTAAVAEKQADIDALNGKIAELSGVVTTDGADELTALDQALDTAAPPKPG